MTDDVTRIRIIGAPDTPPTPGSPNFIIPNTWDQDTDGYWDGAVTRVPEEGGSARAVQAGDIIQLEAGTREPIYFRNIHGAAANRVIIRSDPAGKVIIKRAVAKNGGTSPPKSNGFIVLIKDSTFFTIDGSTTAGEFHGIKIMSDQTNDGPAAYLRATGKVKDYTVRYVEIDGGYPTYAITGIGCSLGDATLMAADWTWWENIIYEHCWVHHTRWSAMYLGNNYSDTGGPARGAPPTRNVIIRYCKATDLGRRGFSIKMGQTGTGSRIHHNYTKNTGLHGESTLGFLSGGTFFEGTGQLDNNWIENAGWHSFQNSSYYTPDTVSFPPFVAFNNICVVSGLETTSSSHGITCDAPLNMAYPQYVQMYNNTIISPQDDCLYIGSEVYCDVTVQNNILSGYTGNAVTDYSKGTAVVTPNETGSVASQNFGTSYALTTSSPAKNAATSGLVSTIDANAVRAWVVAGADCETSIESYVTSDQQSRPLGADECMGALEFTE